MTLVFGRKIIFVKYYGFEDKYEKKKESKSLIITYGTQEPLLRERLMVSSVCGRKRIFAKANIKGSRYNLSGNKRTKPRGFGSMSL